MPFLRLSIFLCIWYGRAGLLSRGVDVGVSLAQNDTIQESLVKHTSRDLATTDVEQHHAAGYPATHPVLQSCIVHMGCFNFVAPPRPNAAPEKIADQHRASVALSEISSELEGMATSPFKDDTSTWSVITVWALFWGCVILIRIWSIFHGHNVDARWSSERLELIAWQRGYWNWLGLSWTTRWIYRLSNLLSEEKAMVEDLGTLGHPDDEAEACFARFSQLWEEEVQTHGIEQASLWRIIIKFVTWRLISVVTACTALVFFFDFIARVFIVEIAVNYVVRVAAQAEIDNAIGVSRESMLMPVLAGLVAFWAIPMTCVCCDIASSLIVGRKCIRIQQALLTAIYRKAQRLPPGARDVDAEDEDSLVNLVNADVLLAFDNFVCRLVQTVVAVITLCFLMAIAFSRLKLAIFGGFIGVAPIGVLMFVGVLANVRYNEFQVHETRKRVSLMQEILQGIRTIKCCAWDRAALREVFRIRERELQWLKMFWWAVGFFVMSVQSVGPVLIFCTLASHVYWYHTMSSSLIFVCIQVLNNLRDLTKCIGDNLGRLPGIFAAVGRIDRFLRQPEAPMLSRGHAGDLTFVQRQDNHDGPLLRVKGDFSWTRDGPVALSEIDISVRHGELLAILGDAGSGKTTLLHAMLGELCRRGVDSQVLRPQRIAYCAQTPWIFDGTLKDNVVFAAEYEDERYNAVLSSACLLPDLEVLPGRDQAFLGTRGVQLSAGQKMRISLARAAYSQAADAMLVDDPFSSLDTRTATQVFQKLFLDPNLKERARVVVLQPDMERLAFFDRVVVLKKGRVIFDGRPQDAQANELFQGLFSASQSTISEESSISTTTNTTSSLGEQSEIEDVPQPPSGPLEPAPQEEDDVRRPATWSTLKSYMDMGGWAPVVGNVSLWGVQTVLFQLGLATLARWANLGQFNNMSTNRKYLCMFLLWFGLTQVILLPIWHLGITFSFCVSKIMHDSSVKAVLSAPLDKFFDKHPRSRVLNRLSNDMMSIDSLLFIRCAEVSVVWWSFVMPLGYVHIVMPWSFTMAAVPIYVGVYLVVLKYWQICVSMRNLTTMAKHDLISHFEGVLDQTVALRAFQEMKRAQQLAVLVQDRWAHSVFACNINIRMWIICTVSMLFSMLMAIVGIFAVVVPGWLGPGTFGLCIINCYAIQSAISYNLENMSGVQFEFIPFHRLRELMVPNIPQEKACIADGDKALEGFTATVTRKDLADLEIMTSSTAGSGGAVQVVLKGSRKVIFESSPDGAALIAADNDSLAELAPRLSEFQVPTLGERRHHLVSANSIMFDAVGLAEELCWATHQLQLEFQGGWLAGGAHVQIEDLRAGYSDQRDVLRNISMEVAPKQKVALVGAAGSGKSTLLLSILRILEPRGGQILLSGVDTTQVGLWALRRAVGFVTSDAFVFSGTIRYNLDPFSDYSDERLWYALRLVKLESLVSNLPDELNCPLQDVGSDLVFGERERQLLCLARMAIRKPGLLLLDEAPAGAEAMTLDTVKQALSSAFANSTIIAVLHDMERIADFDVAVVMQKGLVVERGPVSALLAIENGHLAKMCAANCR
mmetsp:Transcript_41879/g.73524  ORF Transcript_41879/g.73524 Transcript_41879/m.73524 type:complete len:1555 (-) Transcript_41879:84-4748(-)